MIRFARTLVAAAARTLALPPSPEPHDAEDARLETVALGAIDAYVASPFAHRYLAAMRALASLSCLRRRAAGTERLARRALDAEIDRLAQSALLPRTDDGERALEQLRALPADARAPRRLQALTALLEAHRAIALRVREPERLRAPMEMPPPGLTSRGRDRRQRGRGVLRA
jgi:hypothetical protein